MPGVLARPEFPIEGSFFIVILVNQRTQQFFPAGPEGIKVVLACASLAQGRFVLSFHVIRLRLQVGRCGYLLCAPVSEPE